MVGRRAAPSAASALTAAILAASHPAAGAAAGAFAGGGGGGRSARAAYVGSGRRPVGIYRRGVVVDAAARWTTVVLSMSAEKKEQGPLFSRATGLFDPKGDDGVGGGGGGNEAEFFMREGSTLEPGRNPIPSKPGRNRRPAPPPPSPSPKAAGGGAGGGGGSAGEGWGNLKDALYSAADAAKTALGPSKEEGKLPRPVGGYADAVERRPGETPAQAVLRAAEEREAAPDWERSRMDYDAYVPSDEELEFLGGDGPSPGASFFDGAPPGTAIGGGSREEEEEEKLTGFTAIKDGIYDAYDVLSGKKKKKADAPEEKGMGAAAAGRRPVDRIRDRAVPLDPDSFSPLSRPPQNADPALRRVDPSVARDLTSPNPVARAKARYALRSAEERARRRERAEKRRETAEKVKEAAYGLGDGLVRGAELAARAAAEAPGAAREAVDAARSLPGNVRDGVDRTVKDVKGAADETRRITNVVYQDIVNIPAAVKTKVDDTKRSIEETKKKVKDTKKSIEDTVADVQDAVYDAEAALGLVPPRPKPPPPPPPPPPEPTAEELARKAAGAVLRGAGKTAWWTLKGTLWLGGQGAKAVFNKATEGLRSQGKGAAAAAAEELRGRTETKGEVRAALAELAKVDEELSREVADALRVAEETLSREEGVKAVEIAKKEAEAEKKAEAAPATPPPAEATVAKAKAARGQGTKELRRAFFFTDDEAVSSSMSSSSEKRREINDAVRKAREAAARAARDAAELEAMLKEDRGSGPPPSSDGGGGKA